MCKGHKIDSGEYNGVEITVYQTGPTDNLCFTREYYAKTMYMNKFEGSYTTALHHKYWDAINEVCLAITDN